MKTVWTGRARVRRFVARVLIVALLLPTAFSLGSPDPHWLLGIESAPERSAHHHPAGTPGHEHDGSNIPGSAGHPSDHNCNPCQVLKYLAIYLPQLPLSLPDSAPAALPRIARDQAQRAGHLASLPPSRAPPLIAA
jgi:hypothetical protein